MNRQKLKLKIQAIKVRNCNLEEGREGYGLLTGSLERDAIKGESPVHEEDSPVVALFIEESGCLGLQP